MRCVSLSKRVQQCAGFADDQAKNNKMGSRLAPHFVFRQFLYFQNMFPLREHFAFSRPAAIEKANAFPATTNASATADATAKRMVDSLLRLAVLLGAAMMFHVMRIPGALVMAPGMMRIRSSRSGVGRCLRLGLGALRSEDYHRRRRQ